ncbi:C-terminal binding protein [Halorussus salinisoli]|uniref:C-terminal binding protein n=1 Tax=Halorussus salinisoli TaxID=2558242 RepID=UPI0014853F02|nr:C-terminal binding protein [Halorussus salinisoli]
MSIERDVFDGLDVTFRPVDVRSTNELIEKLDGVDAVIDRVLNAPYTAEVVTALDCDIIARCGIGVDKIDLDAAAEQGTYVVNVPSYCEEEVSEHALLLVLALERNLIGYDADLKRGRWEKGVGSMPIHRLGTRTLGLVGFGTIARLVAEKAQALGMDVVATDPYVDADEMEDHGVEKRSFDAVVETADTVSVHAPLTEETQDTFDADIFARMKSDAYFVNVARGGLVVESDLREALQNGDIAGAALDVFREEPADRYDGPSPTFESEFRELENVILTPHIAWYSVEASDEKRRTAARDVRRVLEGENPQNAVNEPSGLR